MHVSITHVRYACFFCVVQQPMLRHGKTGDWIGTFAGHKGAVWSAKLCCKALLAATGAGDFTAAVWNAVTGEMRHSFVHRHIVKSVDFSPDRTRLATAGSEGLLRIFDINKPSSNPRSIGVAVPEDTSRVVINQTVWLDNTLVCTGSTDKNAAVWDTRSPRVVKRLVFDEAVMDIEHRLNSAVNMLTIAAGTKVSFFDPVKLELVKSWTMPVHFKREGGASLSPDGKTFIVGGGRIGGSSQGAMGAKKDAKAVGELDSDLIAYVFDYSTGKLLEKNKGHCGPVRCLRFHPEGTSFASGSEDGTIRLWDAKPAVPAVAMS